MGIERDHLRALVIAALASEARTIANGRRPAPEHFEKAADEWLEALPAKIPSLEKALDALYAARSQPREGGRPARRLRPAEPGRRKAR